MSKFNFRLQKILDHRETVENVNKGKYGTAKRMLEQELEKLENIEEMKNFLNKEKENIVEKTTTIESLKIYNSCLTDIAEKIKVQNKKIEEAEHVVEKTRYELIESTKEKK
ncbi:flagellar export protein FliJ [Gottschalkia acidurici 9a]|uniref:Flagellar FliJ protein n=1 Tax=Gottschalkia acidurici (strain ATCC 7906 / DSM 604 / BCRC 14475 / CIP 104303 / KCTC 5404 / NCIMB 10678 / 9a) TaxID=1128398 RepID=K0AXR7_GOTA9|nr:flagellar FliJ family protein [Gottschalkia acidurici]AFS78608.1 flagellar export protein FliJ [Gottschalkia acidurici 9a]